MSEERPRQFATLYLASDHAGFAYKEAVKEWLSAENFLVIDAGAEAFDGEDDFPDFVIPAVGAMVGDRGGEAGAIVFGGSGQGEAMAANRVKGARAVLYYGGNKTIPALGREHNAANVLSIGARFVTLDETKEAIWNWLHTEPLHDPKYARRNEKLDW
jgi:ribose 5-phosphate isomerase B